MPSLQVITATAKEWIAALARLTPATSGRKVMPILGMVHIDPAAGTLRAHGKDVVAETYLAAQGSGDPFLVSYSWLLDAIKSTTGRNRAALVTLTAAGEHVTVESLGYKIHVASAPVADFMTAVAHKEFSSHSALDAMELRDALSRALIASSYDAMLPVLNAVCFEQSDVGVRLLATDRYRLTADLVIGPGNGNERFTLPAATLKLITKQLTGGTVYVKRATDGGPAIIRTDLATYTVTPIEADYPHIETLFKDAAATVVDVARDQLLEAAKVAAHLSERNTPAFLDITKDGVQVSFNGGLFGPDLAPNAAGDLTGAEVSIALNSKFFVEAMATFKGDRVRIHGNEPNKAFTFIDGGADLADKTIYRHMIMTVRMPEQDGNRG